LPSVTSRCHFRTIKGVRQTGGSPRRFSLQTIVGIPADEDDGNAANKKIEERIHAANVKPTAGAMESLQPEKQKQVLDMAIQVKDAWEQGDIQTAFTTHRKHNKALSGSAEEQAGLWNRTNTTPS
jgi:hypothetical protein